MVIIRGFSPFHSYKQENPFNITLNQRAMPEVFWYSVHKRVSPRESWEDVGGGAVTILHGLAEGAQQVLSGQLVQLLNITASNS